LPRTNLDFAEETILACLDERSTLSRLSEITHLSNHEFGRAMYSLLISGMLRVQGDTSSHGDSLRTEVQQRWLSFGTIPGVKNIAQQPIQHLKTIPDQEVPRLIQDMLKKIQTGTYEEILQILPDFTETELQI